MTLAEPATFLWSTILFNFFFNTKTILYRGIAN